MSSWKHWNFSSQITIERHIHSTGYRAIRHSLLIGMLALLGSQASIAVPANSAGTVKVSDGTIIKITLTENLSSAKNHQNDQVHGVVAEGVKIGGSVVIAKGAPVIGHVTQAEPKGRWGHSGSLAYTLDYAKAVDGSNVRLRASASMGGEQSKAALMLGLSGAFKHGKDVVVPKGTSLEAYIDGDHLVAIPEATH